jgi:diaminopimelate decarboxylase
MKHILDELETICREPVRESPPEAFLDAVKRIDGKTLLESVRRFGTPQYFIDLDALKERALFFACAMREHIPDCGLFYAFKCNDLPILVKTLKKTGYQADVAGLFELQLGLRLGFERILFSGPGKSKEELTLAVENGDRVTVIIDNMDELLVLREMTCGLDRTMPVGFRLNSGAAQGTSAPWSKFGFELDDLPEAIHAARESGNLKWTGLHFHASWNRTPAAYLENIGRIGRFLGDRIHGDDLRNLQFFDIGGGFYPEGEAQLHKGTDKGILLDILKGRSVGVERLREELRIDPLSFVVTDVEPLETFAAEISRCVRKHIMPLAPGVSIYLEPGRFIATASTTILLRVTAVKRNCVIVDGGINMLGDYKFSEYAFSPVVNITRPSERLERRLVYGPLCDPHDMWGYSYYGDGLKKDDILAVLHQGAYTFSTAWRFIKPIPPYIAYSGGRLILAKKAEGFRNRYAGCRI